MNLRMLSAALLLVAGGTVARATDVPVTGLKLIVVDKTASSGSAKVVFVAKDAGISKGAGTEASSIFAELGISYDAVQGTFDMPPGPGWVANKDTVAKYTNGGAPSGGAVKVSIIKPGLLIKVVGKSLGDGEAIDISSAPVGDVFVTHSVLNGEEAFRHCTRFGTCIHKVIAGGTGYKLICKEDSSGDPTCAAAPPPACCSFTDPATLCTFVPSVLACTSIGGTPGAASSVCDSATGTCTVSATAGGCCEGFSSPFGDLCFTGPDITVDFCPGSFSGSAVCSPNGSCL